MELLEALNACNDVKIYSVEDAEFSSFGRIIKGYDFEELETYMNLTSQIPEDGNVFVASVEEMERELMKSSKAFGDFTRSLTVGWKDVQKGLGDDDVAIEFLASPVLGGDSILYVALTLKKGYDKPKMMPSLLPVSSL